MGREWCTASGRGTGGEVDLGGTDTENDTRDPNDTDRETATGTLGTFAKAYKTEFGKDAGTYSSEAFDAANILMKGVEAGNTTRAKLLARRLLQP